MEEEFRPIKHYNQYRISNVGNVLNTDTGRLLKIQTDPNGKQKIMLYNKGHSRIYYIHRLVAEAFYPDEYKDGLAVEHVSRDFTDNSVENLRVSTRRARKPDGTDYDWL